MGSVTMNASEMQLIQLLLVVFRLLCVCCEEIKDDHKPAVVDWEQNNFGIRTSHSHENVLNNVNIDRNAPRIPKRVKPVQHKSERKQIQPTIRRNNLKIRHNSISEKPREFKHTKSGDDALIGRSSGRLRSPSSVSRRKSVGPSSDNMDTGESTSPVKKTEVSRPKRLKTRIRSKTLKAEANE